jgi:integrase
MGSDDEKPARKKTRRQRGEGGLSQRADGLWRGTLDLGWGLNGKRRQKVVYAKTKAEAAKKLNRLKRELEDTGTIGDGDQVTVEGWLTHWLTDIAARKVRPSTLQGYKSKINEYLVPYLGQIRLNRLTPQHVRDLDATLAKPDPARGRAKGLAGATRRQTHAILMRALTVAVREGKLARNVADMVDRPKLDRGEYVPLSLDEISRIIRAAADDPLESRWLAALVLGLRQGEALGLRWSDVDLDAGTMTIRQALQRVTGQGRVFVEPKSRASRRTLPIPETVLASLRAYREKHPASRGLVWCQANGLPTDPRLDWLAWKALLVRAEVRPMRLHDARHAAATVLAALGVHPAIARDILGHSTITLTMQVYTHSGVEQLRGALDAVDKLHTGKGDGNPPAAGAPELPPAAEG